MRARILVMLVGTVGVVPLSCHLIPNLGDLTFADTDAGAGGSGTGSTTTSSSTGGAGGTGAGGQGGVGGGGSVCLLPISDDFDDEWIDTSLWNIAQQQSIEVGENSAGRLYLKPDPDAYPTWAEILSWDTFDLTDCAVAVELHTALNNDAELQTMFTVGADTWENSAGFAVRHGQLASRVVEGGVEIDVVETPYVAGDHHWLRLREADGTLYFETSGNGLDWIPQHTASTPSYATAAHVRMAGGSWSVGSSAPGQAEFDNLNVLP